MLSDELRERDDDGWRKTMRAFLIGLFAFVMIPMTGCLGLPKIDLSATDRAQVKTIKIRTDERLPPLSYHGKAQAIAGAFGAVGGAVGAVAGTIVASTFDDPAVQLLELMKANNIHLPSIVAGEFSQAMQYRGWQVVDLNSPADAEMLLIVNNYGLISRGLDGILRPSLHVSASLRKPDGTVIWQKNGHANVSDGSRFEWYMEHPESLRDVWAKVSRVTSQQLVNQGL